MYQVAARPTYVIHLKYCLEGQSKESFAKVAELH